VVSVDLCVLGECKYVMLLYMACLKEHKNRSEPCRHLSKGYLECRMLKYQLIFWALVGDVNNMLSLRFCEVEGLWQRMTLKIWDFKQLMGTVTDQPVTK